MSTVRYVNDLGNGHSGLLDVGNGLPVLTGLSIPAHDSITLSYTGTNLTVDLGQATANLNVTDNSCYHYSTGFN